jgi:hypothetical protein
MKTRMLLLLGCLLALLGNAQATTREMWVWKDANGVTHYSDVPAPGAKRMTIASGGPAAPAEASPPTAAAPPTADARPGKVAPVQYSSLEIWSPENGTSFFGADASVDIRLRSEPDLAPGDRLLTYLDGKLIEGAQDAYEHRLTNLDRGAHSVAAVIIDAQGTEKIRSEPRVFHVKQIGADNPRNVGPALKPQPAPQPAPAPAPPKSNK